MKHSKILYVLFLTAAVAWLSSCDKVENNSVSVVIGDIVVADRNAGAQRDGIALNYTNLNSHVDRNNSSFKGLYYNWSEAMSICPEGWRLPTKAEFSVIANEMKFEDGRAYLENDEGDRCYFPLSGKKYYESSPNGYYWTSTELNNYGIYAWEVLINSDGVKIDSSYQSACNAVRCVKTVE